MPEFYGSGGYGLGLYDAADNVLVFTPAVTYYINLLILQYANKPKARATIGSLVKVNVADEIYKKVEAAFDIETAFGAQLDILAQYVGAQRTVFGIDLTHEFFSFAFATDADVDVAALPGFAFTTDALVSDFFLTVPDANAPVYAMNDAELRALIQFLAKRNSTLMSMKEVDDLAFEFFGGYVNVIDNEDMTMTYVHDIGDPSNLFYIVNQLGLLPHPAGVKVIVT